MFDGALALEAQNTLGSLRQAQGRFRLEPAHQGGSATLRLRIGCRRSRRRDFVGFLSCGSYWPAEVAAISVSNIRQARELLKGLSLATPWHRRRTCSVGRFLTIGRWLQNSAMRRHSTSVRLVRDLLSTSSVALFVTYSWLASDRSSSSTEAFRR